MSRLSRYPQRQLGRTPRQRKRLSDPVLHVVTLVALAYTAYYLIWRLSTFNSQALWLSWALWAAEAFGFLSFVLFAFLVWRLVNPVPPRPKPNISVDVFVPTLNEPVDILRETLVGCNHIRYPHQTFVLDDGNRDEVRALAAALGCSYIARPTHGGAKAGNINYALQKTKGELAAILDADHVPLPNFLDDTIGFFEDSRVAVVQGPQLFYNLDSFEHSNSGWHEQQMFFHLIQPGKNRTNSAFWCGSPSVVRRSALEAIGGVAEETVTEDLHTSIRLVKKGYHTVYVDRPLAFGVAPATVEDFLAQRFRWGQGAMQALRKDNPLWARSLTPSQRISFFASMVTYFEGPQRLIFLGMPIVALLTGLLPIQLPSLSFWLHFVPYLVLILGANAVLASGTYNMWNSERYNTLKAFTFTSAIATLFTGRARPFRVTRKDAGASGAVSWRPVIPHLVTIGLCSIAIVVGVFHLFHPLWYQLAPVGIAIALFWALINLSLLVGGVTQLRRVSRRARYRFPIRANLRWRLTNQSVWHSGYSFDLSASGIGLENMGPKLTAGDHVEVTILPADSENETLGTDKTTQPVGLDFGLRLVGTVIGNHPSSAGPNQWVGLSIQNFASEMDETLYAHLLHRQEAQIPDRKLPRKALLVAEEIAEQHQIPTVALGLFGTRSKRRPR